MTKNFNPLNSEFMRYKQTETVISFFENDTIGDKITIFDGRRELRIKILSRENSTKGA